MIYSILTLTIWGLTHPIWASHHPYPTFDQVPHPVNLQGTQRGARVKRDTLGPLRIKVFYHPSVDLLRPNERRTIKEVVSNILS